MAVDNSGQGSRHGGLPWEWILEHLVDNKHVGTPILQEMTRYIPEKQCRSCFQRRISLRYLEEMIASGTFDARAIPLLRTVVEDSSSGHKDILLRMQIEAVLTHIRLKPRNWHLFHRALELHLPADSRDSQLLEKRAVFLALLQILQDVLGSNYPPHQEDEAGPLNPRKGKGDHCSAAESHGSDDPTVVGGGRNSDADSEETPRSKYECTASAKASKDSPCDVTKKRDPVPAVCLRQRDQSGKAMTSTSPLARRQVNCHSKIECIKCRKTGSLIFCIGCPMAVHRDCLGFDSGNSIEEEWYCPLCFQKKAADALLLAKQEERVARERLAKFLEGTDTKKRLSTALALLSKREENVYEIEANLDHSLKNDSQVEHHMHATGINAVISALELRDESNLDHSLKNDSQVEHRMHAPGKTAEIAALELREESNRSIPGEGEDKKECFLKQSVTPSKAAGFEPSACHSQEKGFKYGELAAEHMLGDINTAKLITMKGSEQVKRQNGEGCEGEPPQLLPEVRGSKPPATCMHIDPKSRHFEEHAAEADVLHGDLGEDKQVNEVSRRARIVSRENHHSGMRRKRLRWTKEEEDTLKESVKKFSRGNGEWGFQWTRIMDFGRGTFHPSRTVVDLKDKWRNLSRSHGHAASSSD